MLATRTKTIKVRLTEEEHRQLTEKAEAAGETLSALLRDHAGRLTVRNSSQTLHHHLLLNRIANQLGVIARLCQDTPDTVRTVEVLVHLVALDREVNRIGDRITKSL